VHGYAGVAETWDYQLEHFAGSYRVVAPDLRGHGLSDAPDSRWIIHTEAKTYMIADGGEIGGLAADAAWAMAADANQVKSAPL
jgi:pimeloyl-ACP methyl ester carboxylesterase